MVFSYKLCFWFGQNGESYSLARRGLTREEPVEHLLRGIGKFGQNS